MSLAVEAACGAGNQGAQRPLPLDGRDGTPTDDPPTPTRRSYLAGAVTGGYRYAWPRTLSARMKIGRRPVGPDHPPVIVAELSANHKGSLERALAVVDAVADAGAHVLKLQTYTADTMTLDVDRPEFRIDTPGSLWQGRTLYDLYQEGSTPWDWHEPIAERCREHGLDWFSSPFDATAVDFLEQLEPAAYKIASFEIVDLPLIAAVASTGKPVVISTGMATLAEIDAAVCTARHAGCADLVLLQCTSTYPATAENSHLATIPHSPRPSTAPSACPITRWGSACRSRPSALGRC